MRFHRDCSFEVFKCKGERNGMVAGKGCAIKEGVFFIPCRIVQLCVLARIC